VNLIQTAWAAFEAEDFDRAERDFRRARLEPLLAAEARHGLVYVFARTGRFEEARAECHLLQLEAQSQNNKSSQYVALHQLGMVERMAGELETALKIFGQEQAIIASLENPPLAVSANAYEMGIICGKLERYPEARDWLALSLEQAQLSGDAIAEACAYRGLGEVAANPTMKKAMLLQSLAAFERGGDALGAAEIQDLLLEKPPMLH
jgi:tetratricopeptide (TPR) repeat protein